MSRLANLPSLTAAIDPPPWRQPANVEAEQAVLGVLLSDPDAVWLATELQPTHFFEPFHGRLFDLIRSNTAAGKGSPVSLLAARLADDPAWQDLGGLDFLGDLIRCAPPTANLADFSREVLAAFTRRELIRVSSEIGALAADRESDPDALLAEAEACVAALSGVVGAQDAFGTAGDVVRDAITHARERSGRINYPTGVAELDRMLGGLNAGEATLYGARPGMGKTVAAMCTARANAEAGLGVCFFSLEMSKDALGLRLATDLAYNRRAIHYAGASTNPTAQRAALNDLSADQWADLDAAQAEVARWPLLIDDRAALTLAKVEAAAKRAHARWARKGIKPGPVIVDHIGKLKPSIDRGGNMTAEMADLSAGISNMAKRLGVPVLALVQLNRGVEGRDDKRPLLADLRQAGQLEEDARQVVFLFRPEYYLREPTSAETFEEKCARLEELEKVKNQLFFLIEKNSHGPRGQVRAFVDIGCSAIRDWDAR